MTNQATGKSLLQLTLHSAECFKALTDCSEFGFCTLDLDGTISDVSHRCLRLLHKERAELIGRKFAEVLLNPQRAAELLESFRCKGKVLNFLTKLVPDANGKILPVAINAIQVRDCQSIPLGTLIRITDATEKAGSQIGKQQLASIVEDSNEAIYSKSLDGAITSWNKSAEIMFGYTQEEIIGSSVKILVPDGCSDEFDTVMHKVQEGVRVEPFVTTRMTKDGVPLPVSIRISPITDIDGNTIGASVISTDVSEQLKHEEEQIKLRELIELSKDFMAIATPDARVFYVNKSARRMIGVGDNDDLAGKFIWDLHPYWKDWLQLEAFPAAIKDGFWRGETRVVHSNGQERILEQIIIAHRSSDGKLTCVSTVGRDITDRKRREKEYDILLANLQDSEEQFKQICACAQDGIVAIDAEGSIRLWNDAASRIFGYSESEAIGKKVHEFLAPENVRAEANIGIRNFSQSGMGRVIGKTVELVAFKANGQSIQIELSVSSAYIKGKWTAIGVVRDITCRKSLEEERDNLMKLIELTSDFVGMASADGKAFYLNKGGRLMLGMPLDEDVIGQSIASSIAPDFVQSAMDQFNKVLNGGVWQGEIELLAIDGRRIPVSQVLVALHSAIGGSKVATIMRDISEHKRLEQETKYREAELGIKVAERTALLERSNKEWQSFCYTISHDLRTPLRALSSFGRMLIEECGENLSEAAKDYTRRIYTAAERMGRLVDDLLEFSDISQSPVVVETVNLSNLANQVKDCLQLTDSSRRVTFDIQEGLMCLGNAKLVETLLIKLFENSWKFTSKQEAAVIRFRLVEEGEHKMFCVSDNGAGFDSRFVDKLFVPFHRLHKADEFSGEGIGLAIARRIVERHGGSIKAEGQVGQGARFYFSLDSAQTTIPSKELVGEAMSFLGADCGKQDHCQSN